MPAKQVNSDITVGAGQRTGLSDIADHEGLTGWGGKMMSDMITDRQWAKDAQAWRTERETLWQKMLKVGKSNLSRSERIQFDCHRAVEWWLGNLDGSNPDDSPTPPGWTEGLAGLHELAADYNLCDPDGNPTPAVGWLQKWADEGAPASLADLEMAAVSPGYTRRRAHSGYKGSR